MALPASGGMTGAREASTPLLTRDGIMMLSRLEVPDDLQRNAPDVAAAGYEETGQILIDHAQRCIGIDTLADKDVLDVGCAVRFVRTIINRGITIRSYSGLEVSRPVADFLEQARHIREHGALFFSAFVDEKLDGFEDRVPERPLLNYGRSYLASLIAQCGWSVVRDYPRAPAQAIQHHFVCAPDPGAEPRIG